MKKGIPEQNSSFTLLFDYGEITSLEKLFEEHPGDIAAVMMEPASTLTPCPSICEKPLSYKSSCSGCPNHVENFLHRVENLCKLEETLFILDEMITGFRWHLQGAAVYFGVKPDLSIFG